MLRPAAARGARCRSARRARYGIRLALAEVKGITEAEVARIVAARPYHSLTDFWHRAQVSRPVVERLVLAGAFDAVYGIGSPVAVRRRRTVTRRDLLLQVAELDRHARAVDRASRGRGLAGRKAWQVAASSQTPAQTRAADAAARNSTDPRARGGARPSSSGTRSPTRGCGPRRPPSRRPRRRRGRCPRCSSTLDLGDAPGEGPGELSSGLPEMTAEERMRAELEILGLDVSRHVVDSYARFLDALGVTRSRDLLPRRSQAELLVAGVKVATQTPPIRSGRRVVFLTLDDATGPVDATFFEDAQGPYAATVFHSWLLVVRGELRRTGRRGVSLRATGCWELPALLALWQSAPTRPRGSRRCARLMAVVPEGFAGVGEEAVAGAAGVRSTRPVMSKPAPDRQSPTEKSAAGGMGRRRVLVHSSGFQLSPYADIKPAGEDDQGRRPQAVAPQPRERRMTTPLGLAHVRQCSARRRAAPVSSERRSAARTAVVWEALRPVLDGTAAGDVLDIGGGTGGFAVRVAELGHRVPVVDPSPDALAALDRRARESGVADRVTGLQGDLSTLLDVTGPGQRRRGALPRRARGRRRPGRRARHDRRGAAPRRRAQPARRPAARRGGRPGDGRPLPAGHGAARLHRRRPAGAGHRFTREELAALLAAAGLDARPRSTRSGSSPTWSPAPCSTSSPAPPQALVELEQAVAERPEYLPLATQLHVLAQR